MLSLEERAELLVRVAELHKAGAFPEIIDELERFSDEELCSEMDLGYSLALANYRLDRFDVARRLNRLFLARSRVQPVDRLYRKHLILKGILSVESGELFEAEAAFHEAMAYAARADDHWVIADVMMNLGVLSWIACRWDEALTYYARAMTAYTALGRRYSIAACHQNIGMTYREIPMIAEAESHFETAYLIYAAAPVDRSYELSLVESERALLICGLADYERAEAMARRALARVSNSAAVKHQGEALRALGIVLRGRKSIKEARVCLLEALHVARVLGSRLLEAEVSEELFNLEEDAGAPELAKQYGGDAIRIYHAIGAAARGRALLLRTGVPVEA